MGSLSLKQVELLNNVFKPFKCKYPELTLNEFVLKFSNKNIDQLNHKNLFFLINKVNSGYDYWNDKDKDKEYNPLKPTFNKLKYVIKNETDEYIIGTQYHYDTYLKKNVVNSLKVIAFKYLMVLDYDIHNESKEELLRNITENLSKTNSTFLLYETENGYHAYNISKKYPYYKKETYQEMFKLNCDPWYINFTKYVGFVTRLEKKINRNEKFIEKFVKQINNYLIDIKLKEIVEFKDTLVKDSIVNI
jgi:hypothetical protein